jgi:hypothetical protein
MTQRNRDLARRGTVAHRVVPAQLACRVGARAQAREHNAWPAVVSIALGSFALVFSEVIPVGLLSSLPAGSADLARERARDSPASPHGATHRAGNSAQRAR